MLALLSLVARTGVAAGSELELLAGPHVLRARLWPDVLGGPEVALHRRDGRLEGQLLGSPVALDVRGGRIRGEVRDGRVDLWVVHRRGVVRVEGTFAGQPSRLNLRPSSIVGRIGGCNYELHRASRSFLGVRICAGPLEPMPVALTLPDELVLPERVDQAAMLVLVLADPRAIEPVAPDQSR